MLLLCIPSPNMKRMLLKTAFSHLTAQFWVQSSKTGSLSLYTNMLHNNAHCKIVHVFT